MWRKIGWSLFAICVAFPVLLVVFPGTRWAVTTRAQMVFQDHMGIWAYVEYTDDPPATGRSSQLTSLGGFGRNVSLDEIYDAAVKRWDDPLFLSFYLQEAGSRAPDLRQSFSSTDELKRVAESRIRYQAEWRRMLRVCDQGMILEPGNSFYPAVAAGAAYGVEDSSLAVSYLASAGRATHFDDHSQEITASFRKAMISAFGYRGAEPVANVALWHASWSKGLFGLMSGGLAAEPPSRRAILHVADLVYDQASDVRDLNISAGLINAVADPHPPTGLGPGLRRERQLDRLATLASELDPERKTTTLDRFKEIVAASDYRRAGRVREYPTVPEWEGILGYSLSDSAPQYATTSVVVFVGMLLLLGLTSILTLVPDRFPSLAAVPCLTAACLSLGKLFTFHFEARDLRYAVGYSAFYLLAAVLATRKGLEKPILIATTLLPAALLYPLAMSVTDWSQDDWLGYLAVPVCGFPVLLGLYAWRKRRKTVGKVFIVPQLAAIVFALALIVIFSGFPPGVAALKFGLLFAITVMLVCSWQGASIAEAARQMRRYSYWPAAVAGLCCGLMLTWVLLLDPLQAREYRELENIGPQAKQWAKQNPDGLLADLRRQEELQQRTYRQSSLRHGSE